MVGIEVAVYGGEYEWSVGDGGMRGCKGDGGVVAHVVEHDIAAEDGLGFGKAFVVKVLYGGLGGGEEER